MQTFYGGQDEPGRAAYEAQRDAWQRDPPRFDKATGLRIYIDDFPAMLASIDAPVLALFGEKDSSVDWQSTRALYQTTIGRNPDASLTVRTFPDGNHNLHLAETGGFEEMLAILDQGPETVPGYLEAMVAFLDEVVDGE